MGEEEESGVAAAGIVLGGGADQVRSCSVRGAKPGSDSMLGMSNYHSQGAKGQYIYMCVMCRKPLIL